MSVEGPKIGIRKKESHLDHVAQVDRLRQGQKVLVWDDFPSDAQKPMWLRKGDIGTVSSVDGDGDALIVFPGKDTGGKSLSTIVKKRNFDKIRAQVAAPPTLTKQARAAAPAAPSAAPRKVMIAGDAAGNLPKLFATVESQAAKVGKFDAVLCVGSTLLAPGEAGDAASSLSAFLKSGKAAPSETYIIDDNPALLQASPDGCKLCENLHFLGGYGVRQIQGLRVAYLSGRYDPAVYETPDVDFVGGAFTAQSVEGLQKLVAAEGRGIDILMTCGWPAEIEEKIFDEAAKPVDPDDSRPSWRSACAAPLRELCLALEPRYHIFGTADVFYQRPPFQVPKRGHVCRCIGMGRVGSAGKQRKWLFALSMTPMDLSKPEDLRQSPPNVTPCPFGAGGKRPASQPPADEPPAKRGAGVASEHAELRGSVAQALAAGDMALLQQLAGKLSGASAVVTPPKPREAAAPDRGAAASAGGGSGEAPAAAEAGDAGSAKAQKEETEEEKKAREAKEAKRMAAMKWLSADPKKGVVRFTFKVDGPLGLRLSKDVPPWILEVKDGSLAAKKAPRVPVAGIVIAVNGYELNAENCREAMEGLHNRPVVLDIDWPVDQAMPIVNRA